MKNIQHNFMARLQLKLKVWRVCGKIKFLLCSRKLLTPHMSFRDLQTDAREGEEEIKTQNSSMRGKVSDAGVVDTLINEHTVYKFFTA